MVDDNYLGRRNVSPSRKRVSGGRHDVELLVVKRRNVHARRLKGQREDHGIEFARAQHAVETRRHVFLDVGGMPGALGRSTATRSGSR